MSATTLAVSPSILAIAAAGREAPSTGSLKRKRPGDPIHFSPSLASYTQHLFHARRPAAGILSSTMPRPNPPPTPGSSTDIRGKEGAHAPGLAPFNLPPTAYHDERDRHSSTPSNNGSDSSYRPLSPALPSKRPAGAVIGKEDFELPPPPTRSRKIIQMKPQSDLPIASDADPATVKTVKSQTGGKRKQGAGTTAAGRKIARKTAHSLIERRRRSKMNEEFGVLKDMIPACKGQEMHKLAILQASIDYLRYLERCVSDLQHNKQSPLSRREPPAEVAARWSEKATPEVDNDEEDEEDAEMSDEAPTQPQSAVATPAFLPQDKRDSQISLPSLSAITTTSPSIFSYTAGRHYSLSSASQASFSPYFHSAHTSPAFGPQLSHHTPGANGNNNLGLGSPALKPQDQGSLRQIAEDAAAEVSLARPTNGDRARRSEHELDQEAAGGLLMLNSDRRSWQQREREKGVDAPARSGGLGGMSVRDLLTG